MDGAERSVLRSRARLIKVSRHLHNIATNITAPLNARLVLRLLYALLPSLFTAPTPTFSPRRSRAARDNPRTSRLFCRPSHRISDEKERCASNNATTRQFSAGWADNVRTLTFRPWLWTSWFRDPTTLGHYTPHTHWVGPSPSFWCWLCIFILISRFGERRQRTLCGQTFTFCDGATTWNAGRWRGCAPFPRCYTVAVGVRGGILACVTALPSYHCALPTTSNTASLNIAHFPVCNLARCRSRF